MTSTFICTFIFYSLFNTNPLKLNKNNIYLNKILKERCVNNMNEYERISLEFDIALENSDYMMDTIYSVLSIEGNNIYLKESSGEVDEEEIDDMYTEAVGKFMEKARKLFDTIIEAIKKFFTQLSTAIRTKIRQSQIDKKIDDIEKKLATAKVKELKRKGHTADPRKLVVLYKQYTNDIIAVITKYHNDDYSNVDDLNKELHAIESSDKYKDLSLEELDIIGTSVKENINFTKAEIRNMDRLNDKILSISVSAEEKLKEYATKADNSDTVNLIHSAGSKIASAGKKVGKLASDHPFITFAAIYALYSEARPYVANGVEKIAEKKEKIKREGIQSKSEKKRKKLKGEAIDEVLKSRYDYNVKDVLRSEGNVGNFTKSLIKYDKTLMDYQNDNNKRREKYGSSKK